MGVDIDSAEEGFNDVREEFWSIEADKERPGVAFPVLESIKNGFFESIVASEAGLLGGADTGGSGAHVSPDVRGGGRLDGGNVALGVCGGFGTEKRNGECEAEKGEE